MAMNRIGSNFPVKPVRKLSELIIDYDKDWLKYGIINLKELEAGMTKGDLITHDGTTLVKKEPGGIGNALYTGGPGAPIYWTHP